MIIEPGKVIITKDEITVTNFRFDGVDMPNGQIEVADWAIQKLQDAKEELLSFMNEYEKKNTQPGTSSITVIKA